MIVSDIIFSVIVACICYQIIRICCRYRDAKLSNLPVVFVPFTWQDAVWAFFTVTPGLSKIASRCSWFEYSGFGWQLSHRYRAHAKHGPAFTILSFFGANELILADTERIADLLNRPKRWPKQDKFYTIFNTFGQNVNTVSGKDWYRHRRIVAAGFREQHSGIAWGAAEKQVFQWLNSLDDKKAQHDLNLDDLESTVGKISTNTLVELVFGRTIDLDKPRSEPDPGKVRTLPQSIDFMIENFLTYYFYARSDPPQCLQPKFMKVLKAAHAELKGYLLEILQESCSLFLQAIQAANTERIREGREGLSEEEMLGNMFLFQLAGGDTTMNAITQSLALFAAHPKWQDWVLESLKLAEDIHDNDAKELNVRFTAVMNETLRFFGQAPALTRYNPRIQNLTINDKTHTIPTNTYITTNFAAANHDPSIWGEDVDTWCPSRFIEVDKCGRERLKTKPVNLNWSWGPRICPGKKFSIVIFTAVVSAILDSYEISANQELSRFMESNGFNAKDKKARADGCVITFRRRSRDR